MQEKITDKVDETLKADHDDVFVYQDYTFVITNRQRVDDKLRLDLLAFKNGKRIPTDAEGYFWLGVPEKCKDGTKDLVKALQESIIDAVLR